MNGKEFFKEYAFLLGSYFFLVFLFLLFFWSLHVECAFLILFGLLFFLFGIFWFLFFYFRKKKFYQNLEQVLDSLDQKYLITEMDLNPNFLEAKKLVEILYEINKSMKEKIVFLEETNLGFRDYIEMWIHEVKIPLSNLILMSHNQEKDFKKIDWQLRRVENFVEQVLYYVRSEVVEKDYLIKKVSLLEVVCDVVKKNKEAFILEKVSIELFSEDVTVLTDAKWLAFILNQIISNSLKYRKKKNSKIRIWTEVHEGVVCLKIWDNGMGIKESELSRVFEKSFTGTNGRMVSSSTGMGLAIVKSLIDKLGHQISIISKEGEYTEVEITFFAHDFYEVVNSKS